MPEPASVEVLRMKLAQFNWKKGTVRLYASKTENERDVPLSKGIDRVIRARVRQGLTKSESLSTEAILSGSDFVFTRAITVSFDNTIARPASEPLVWLSSIMGKLTGGHAAAFDTLSLLI